jgi:hypothetical protein
MPELRIRAPRVAGRLHLVPALAASAFLFASCGAKQPPSPTAPSQASQTSGSPASPPPVPLDLTPAVLVGAGDIAGCSDLTNAHATSRLLDGIAGTVFTTGDNTQAQGATREFSECYEPTWGRHRARTRPTLGNHDFETAAGAAYYQYFGDAAGPAGLGYYSYNLGSWHIVTLNGNVSMKNGSPQNTWLRQDLEANRTACTLAYWHQPLFSSSTNGNNAGSRDAWQALYEYGAEVVLNGHDHLFERFAPQDPSGRLDMDRGIRQFTVGTGGYSLYKVVRLQPNSEVQASVHGVLKLTLRAGSYDWQFITVSGSTFSDFGTNTCH